MYFEDYIVGEVYPLDPLSFSKEEIIEFAKLYDPRDIHMDEKVAEESRFKGLIASGMMTLTATWGQWVHTKRDANGVIAGIGFDKVRWYKPVYPDMDLFSTVIIADKKESSNGKSGTVTFELRVKDKEGQDVMVAVALVLIAKSPQNISEK